MALMPRAEDPLAASKQLSSDAARGGSAGSEQTAEQKNHLRRLLLHKVLFGIEI